MVAVPLLGSQDEGRRPCAQLIDVAGVATLAVAPLVAAGDPAGSLALAGPCVTGFSEPACRCCLESGHPRRSRPEAIAEAVAKAGSADAQALSVTGSGKNASSIGFGRRWGTVRYILRTTGLVKVFPAPAAKGDGGSGGTGGGGTGGSGGEGPAPGGVGHPTVGVKKPRPGPETATSVRRKGGVPDYRWTDESEVDPSMAAVWSPNDPRHPNGVVLLNRQFAPFVELREYWKQAYADHLFDEVQKCIEDVYGEVMVAKVAHSEELRSDPRWGGARVESELRSPVALTMAALGLIAEDYLIAARLRARIGAKAKSAAA